MALVGQGKTAFVTGANTGLGYETALQLAQKGFRVLVGSRSIERGNAAINAMKLLAPKGNFECVELDLDSLDAVVKCANAVKAIAPALHVLVLNAGMLPMGGRETTKDRYERCMGVNHLGHFLLTLALIDALYNAAPSRVVVVSSLTHANVSAFDWDDLLLAKESAWSRGRAYAQSKLANVFFAYEFNRRFSHCGIYANALEPGLVSSDILRNASNAFIRIVGTWILRIGGRSAAGAAYTSVFLASDPGLERVGGKFYQPYWSKCREVRSSAASYDEFVAERLWTESAKLVDLDHRLGKIAREKAASPLVRAAQQGRSYTLWIVAAVVVAGAALLLRFFVLRLH